ncbi:MAG: hypothetical protein JWO68_4043, partial [Actinomycetia bacterium]|nr:hypothetical protein [Actinomycetes bacterium]
SITPALSALKTFANRSLLSFPIERTPST